MGQPLRGEAVEPVKFEFFLNSSTASSIRALTLEEQYSSIHRGYFDILLQSPIAKNIQYLSIAFDFNNSDAIHLILQSANLKQLRELNIHFMDQPPTIPNLGGLKKLRSLTVSSFWEEPKSLFSFVTSPELTQLRQLNLASVTLSDADAKALLNAENFNHLEYISLNLDRVSKKVQKSVLQHFGKKLVPATPGIFS